MIDQSRAFPSFHFAGSHREVGRQFGESCRDLIRHHRDLAMTRLNDRAGIAPELALSEALKYRPFVVEHGAFFDEEIQGLAEGADISLAEAYLLQLRAELAVVTKQNASAEEGDECTTFALLPDATADGSPLIGQNADLPAFYAEIGVVVELTFDDMPAILMLTPAGQLSYIGINDRGVGVCANYLTCDGWRYGFPRYFFSRLALTKESVEEGIAAVRGVHRASSRNLLMLDTKGSAADLETTPTRDARLEPEGGVLAHANHYVSPDLLAEERSPEKYIANSRIRQDRMWELLKRERGALDTERMTEILRDRACHPDNLCRAVEDDPSTDTITFASMIAEPGRGKLTIAVGPPHEHAFHTYAFSGTASAAPAAELATAS